MANKPKRRSGFRRLPFQHNMVLLTPATGTVVKGDFAQTVDDKMWFISAELVWGLQALTPGEGPITVGLAHGDYSATEIEEFIEASASWDAGDKVSQEQRRRKIRIVGMFSGEVADEVLNNGNPIKTYLGMSIEEGETVATWAYNQSGGTLTTGAALRINGGLNARQT